jgi:hypothetical protein
MKRSISPFLILLAVLIWNNGLSGQDIKYNLSGDYLGQVKPGLKAKIFAPGIVSKRTEYEFGSVFSDDGNEFYYGVNVNGISEIRYMTRTENKWSKPKRGDFSKGFSCNDPFLSPGGDKLYFISDMPLDASIFKKDIDIWYVSREKEGWSQPVNAGERINSDKNEYYIPLLKMAQCILLLMSGQGIQQNGITIFITQHSRREFIRSQ